MSVCVALQLHARLVPCSRLSDFSGRGVKGEHFWCILLPYWVVRGLIFPQLRRKSLLRVNQKRSLLAGYTHAHQTVVTSR